MSQFPLFNITRQTLEIEWQQCEDEGRIMNLHEREFRQLCAHDLNDPARQRKAEDFLDRTIQMPIRENFPYNEPSSLEEIRRQRGEAPALPPLKITDAELADERQFGKEEQRDPAHGRECAGEQRAQQTADLFRIGFARRELSLIHI